ncbi:MAG: S8 family serine peptidase, partial [Candidatus Nanoarchaeia archaeon]
MRWREVRELFVFFLIIGLALFGTLYSPTGTVILDQTFVVQQGGSASINLDPLFVRERLTFLATQATGLDVSVSGSVLELVAQPGFSGATSVTILASDGENVTEKEFEILVEPVSDLEELAYNTHVRTSTSVVQALQSFGSHEVLITLNGDYRVFRDSFVNDTSYSGGIVNPGMDGVLLEFYPGVNAWRAHLTKQGFEKAMNNLLVVSVLEDDGSNFGAAASSAIAYVEPSLSISSGETKRVIVKLKDSLGFGASSVASKRSAVKNAFDQFRGSVNSGFGVSGVDGTILKRTHMSSHVIMELTSTGLDNLRNNPNVEAVYEDKVSKISLTGSVPLINGTRTHNLSIGGVQINGTNMTICIVDTGLDLDHSDFTGRNLTGHDFENDDPNPEDDNGHGTHVTGIAAGPNGVAPNAFIVPMKVCNVNGSCLNSNIIEGVDFCTNNVTSEPRVSVISISLGDQQEHGPGACPTTFDSVFLTAKNNNITITAASGNDGFTSGINAPSCSPHAIPVGSVTKSDVIAGNSNEGENLDLLAPGVSIVSSALGGGTTTLSGTSMATPHVGGAVILLQQHFKLQGFVLTPNQSFVKLNSTGKPISNWTRINVFDAIGATTGAGPAVAFDYNLSDGSTDFSQEANLDAVSDATLSRKKGRIRWNLSVNATGKNLDKFVKVGGDFVSVNLSGLDSSWNDSANVSIVADCKHDKVFFAEGFPTSNTSILAGSVCDSTTNPSCTNIVCANSLMNFTVSHFTGFTGGTEANLTIFDHNDTGGGASPAVVHTRINFTANFTNATNGVVVNGSGIFCNITFENDATVATMTYDSTEQLYKFNRTFSSSGLVDWNVTCDATVQNFGIVSATDNVTIVEPNCGDTITTSTTLTQNLQNSTGGDVCPLNGLNLTGTGITLDCNGFNITGNGDISASGGDGVIMFGSSNTVRNCKIQRFNEGVRINSSSNTLNNLVVKETSTHITIVTGSRNNVINAVNITNASSDAVIINAGPTTIINSSIEIFGSNNGIQPNVGNLTVQNSTFTGSGIDGEALSLLGSDLVEDNTFQGSFVNGIGLNNGVNYTIRRNVFTNIQGESSDIAFDTAENVTIINNTFDMGNKSLSIFSSKAVSIINNSFLNHDKVAILLGSSDNITIQSNTIFNETVAVNISIAAARPLKDITLNSNTFINNTIDVDIFNATNIRIVDTPIKNYTLRIAGIAIEDSTFGKVQYIGNVTASGSNLTRDVFQANNLLDVNSSLHPGLNQPANITFTNISLTSPQILRNGTACPASVCANLSFSGTTFVFNVTGFTSYSLTEGATDPNCGDTITTSTTLTQNLQNSTGGTICSPTGLQVISNHVVVDCGGFSIGGNDGGGSIGINITPVDNVTIKNCNITDFGTGLLTKSGGSNHTIVNNTFASNAQHISGSSDSSLYQNNSGKGSSSIGVVVDGTGSQVVSNTITHGSSTLIRALGNNTVILNNIVNSVTTNAALINTQNSRNVTIQGNQISNGLGHGVLSSLGLIGIDGIRITSNQIHNVTQRAIELEEGAGGLIDNNNVSSFGTFGIASSARNVTIRNNTVRNGSVGFRIFGEWNISVRDNTIDQTGTGIVLLAGGDTFLTSFVERNIIINSTFGIFVPESGTQLAAFNNNTLIDIFTLGINITNGQNMTIANNTLDGPINLELKNTRDVALVTQNVANYTIITALPLIINDLGKLRYLESITESGVNLSRDVQISNLLIDVNSSGQPGFNNASNITFFNVNLGAPVILRNGSTCPASVCTNLSFLGTTFVFNVTGFTTYSLQETSAITSILLNTTTGLNLSVENLTLSLTGTDNAQNITNWVVNGSSILALNVPMEGGSNAIQTRDYAFENTGVVSGANFNLGGGKLGGAYEFNGTHSLNFSDADQFNVTSGVTYEAWIKPNSFSSSGLNKSIIINKWVPGLEDKDLFITQTGLVQFFLATSGIGGINSSSTATIPLGDFTHIAGTYDGSTARVFINGVLNGTKTGATAAVLNSNGTLFVGDNPERVSFEGGLRGFNGTIDQVRIWNYNLTGEQIAEIFAAENASQNYKTIHSSMTDIGQNWSVNVTPNDGLEASDGLTTTSNTVSILAAVPSITSIILNTTNAQNTTVENLTLHLTVNDPVGTGVKNITVWNLNGTSIQLLNMPFENGTSNSTFTKDYATGN